MSLATQNVRHVMVPMSEFPQAMDHQYLQKFYAKLKSECMTFTSIHDDPVQGQDTRDVALKGLAFSW